MPRYTEILRLGSLAVLLFLMIGCSTLPVTGPTQDGLPPVLAQDELLRPYRTLGRIQVTRDVYFSEYTLTPNLQEWGIKALREEARKMGADALILPEVTSRQKATILLPAFDATEYRATGTAIKFN